MLTEYLLALLVPPLLLLIWACVQTAWRRQFSPLDDERDVLAGRTGCGACGCKKPCHREADHRRFETRRP